MFHPSFSKTPQKADLTLEAFVLSFYLPHIRMRKKSFRVDERIARQYLLPALGKEKLVSLSRQLVEEWLRSLSRNLLPSSCNRVLSVLKAVYSLAASWGFLSWENSPLAGVAFLKTPKEKERALSKEEAHRLMRFLENSTRLEAFALRLLLLTGARKSEVLFAKRENVRVDLKRLMVPIAKSGKSRAIYLSHEAIRVIEAIPQKKGNPWLFPGRDRGKPLSDIYLFWNTSRKQLGLNKVRIHDLRHSFASFLVNGGHTLYEAQKLLGHSNPMSTMRYAHLEESSLIAATETVSSLLFAK